MPKKTPKMFGRNQAAEDIQGFQRDVPAVHTRFTRERRAELEELAKADKVTISEVVRRLVVEALDARRGAA